MYPLLSKKKKKKNYGGESLDAQIFFQERGLLYTGYY